MKPPALQIKLIDPDRTAAMPPKIESAGAAGVDLRACIGTNSHRVQPGEVSIIPSGVAVAIPEGHVGLLTVRSSVGIKRGLVLANGVGVIDSDYRGEVMIAVRNAKDYAVTIDKFERIAQLVVVPCMNLRGGAVELVTELPPTERGSGGIGSTGTK